MRRLILTAIAGLKVAGLGVGGFGVGAAAAHPGHVAEVAGHDHWIAGAAIGAGVLVAIWGGLKSRRAKAEARAAKDEKPLDEAEA